MLGHHPRDREVPFHGRAAGNPIEITDAQGGESTFERYRMLLHSFHRARSAGMSDDDFVGMVHRLDERVAAVDGGGFEKHGLPCSVAALPSSPCRFWTPSRPARDARVTSPQPIAADDVRFRIATSKTNKM